VCLDVGRMSRYRICKIQNPHLEVAQNGCEKNGSVFCVYAYAKNSDRCQM